MLAAATAPTPLMKPRRDTGTATIVPSCCDATARMHAPFPVDKPAVRETPRSGKPLPATAVAFNGRGLLFANRPPLPFSQERNREGRGEGGCMPRRKGFVTVIRDMVREQVQEAVRGLLGAVGGRKKKAKNGRRRRRRGRGPGRPPGSKTRMRRGPGRPRKTEQTAPKVGTRRRKRRGPGRPPKKAKAE